jgi:TolA-binding protein
MKNTFLTLILCLSIFTIQAQTDTTTAGKIVYYEGKVELGNDPSWMRAKINTPVKRNQHIKTTGDAMAEIVWSNGTKTVVGPNSKLEIKALFAGSSSNGKTATAGVFGEFMTVFKNDASVKKTEEGGIRRSEANVAKRDEIYWKQDQTISFAEAFSFYESKEYSKAIAALQAFIDQKPHDEMTKYAEFALGHSYIMSNNPMKAQEIFKNFIVIHAGDPLKADAEKVLSLL